MLRFCDVVVGDLQESFDHHTIRSVPPVLLHVQIPCTFQLRRAANSMTATTHRASLPTSCSQHHSGDMEVHLPAEENLSAPALSSSQMRQLIRTNEALLKTNESLKELVISVVELLRDPTRHATYGEPLRGSDSKSHAQHQKTSSPSLSKVLRPTSPSASVRDTSRRLSSGSFAQDNAYEGTSGTILGENILPMTFEEIDAETAVYRQKYEGGCFYHSVNRCTIFPVIEMSAYCR